MNYFFYDFRTQNANATKFRKSFHLKERDMMENKLDTAGDFHSMVHFSAEI